MRGLAIIVGALLLTAPVALAAHGGRTDKNGCHTDRKTGTRHCHGRAQPAPAPLAGSSQGAFANCAAARAVGAAPVRRGDPGYGRHLDRDNDGVGCE